MWQRRKYNRLQTKAKALKWFNVQCGLVCFESMGPVSCYTELILHANQLFVGRTIIDKQEINGNELKVRIYYYRILIPKLTNQSYRTFFFVIFLCMENNMPQQTSQN